MAPLRFLTIGILRAWRQLYPHFNGLDGRIPKTGSPDSYNSPQEAFLRREVHAAELTEEDSITDSLTALKTRRFLMETLDMEWRRSTRTGRQVSLAIMGLDGLKQVERHMGRPEADKALRAAAAVLGVQSRQSDLVARYGEDEFAILMPEANTQQAVILAERLRAAMQADDFLHAHEVTASFGIATFPDHGRSQEEILRTAAAGMYLARSCNGNCVKGALLSGKPKDPEREKRLLDAYLEAAEKEMPSTVPESGKGSSRPGPSNVIPMRPLLDMIAALTFAVEASDPYRRGHSQTVSRLAVQIVLQAGLSSSEIEEIRLAGLVHDIGKIHVPESVYNKPDLLTGSEYELMRSHAVCGAKILGHLNVKGIEQIVRHHHERYDGQGYPDRLKGEEIPLGARIVAVAECFHNMISDVPYKSTCTFEDALDELRRCSGTQFDPKIVMAFLNWLQMLEGRSKQQCQGDGVGQVETKKVRRRAASKPRPRNSKAERLPFQAEPSPPEPVPPGDSVPGPEASR
jgi:diguanylate cyclase (GGDEF)-like protein/putative nucleotidyltransferase with HDIG domain